MLPRGNIIGMMTMCIRGPPDKEKAHCLDGGWAAGCDTDVN